MQVQEGEGWRLEHDPDRQPFSVLIGGRDWAAELTAAELEALRLGVATLVGQQAAMVAELMAEEALTLEYEQALPSQASDLWLALEGDRQQWCLRFVLRASPGQRSLEGGWPASASAALAAALSQMGPTAADPG